MAKKTKKTNTFICYERCSTCKKAMKWLDEHKVDYVVRPIKEENPTGDELREWISKSGLPIKRFFNTSGQLYRSMELKDKIPGMTEDEIIALLATDGMLVKRPLMIAGYKILVGFKEAEWESLL
ncbi:MAG: arsenate reductase family protein [Lachnospiraceae bacterium]|nr:arsenate reductase family protein [Lachnospiraceae bacterium]